MKTQDNESISTDELYEDLIINFKESLKNSADDDVYKLARLYVDGVFDESDAILYIRGFYQEVLSAMEFWERTFKSASLGSVLRVQESDNYEDKMIVRMILSASDEQYVEALKKSKDELRKLIEECERRW